MEQTQKHTPILSLTALWALVESGLGGIMHAMHLPFTGVFIGGFAVLIIGLIAQLSENPLQDLLKATFAVILIKAAVSPYTSPTAYVAVGFQGLLGALMLHRKSTFKWTVIPFALLCMIESGAQKLLMVWLFFGKSFFDAIDIFMQGALKSFGISHQISYSIFLVLIYCIIYIVWGLFLGIWILKIPKQISIRKEWYLALKPSDDSILTKKNKQNRFLKIIVIIAVIVLVISYFTNVEKGIETGIQLFLRAFLILIIWFLIIIPFWQYFIKKWQAKQHGESKNQILLVNNELALIKNYTKPLYDVLKTKYKGFKLFKELVLGLMVVSIYSKNE